MPTLPTCQFVDQEASRNVDESQIVELPGGGKGAHPPVLCGKPSIDHVVSADGAWVHYCEEHMPKDEASG